MLNHRPLVTHRSRRLRRRRRDGGFSLALMALFLVSMLAMAGLVVDLGSWQVEASRIQNAADAAALASVVRLPDGTAAATSRALEVAKDNGFDNADPNVSVVVTPLGSETIEVKVTETNVKQYFTKVVRGNKTTTITRRGTAQYVQPVPLGSPRNYLGTERLPIGVVGDGVENFFLAISGKCTRREFGDRITPKAMANPAAASPYNCTPGQGTSTANPEYDSRGYLFGITVPPGSPSAEIQVFDAPVCTSTELPTRVIQGEDRQPFDVQITLRPADDFDPYVPAPIATETFSGSTTSDGQCRFIPPNWPDGSCRGGRARECWSTIGPSVPPGKYTLQVNPLLDPAADNIGSGHNYFSLRAKTAGSPLFIPCTNDTAVRDGLLPATPPYSAICPQVFGLEHLPIAARGNNNPLFFLSSIDSRHNGKTLQVTLYDSAEGASGISLVNPAGGTEQVRWEVLCADGSVPTAGACPQGDAPPSGNRSGGPTGIVDVSGNGNKTFASNTQSGKYSDRLLRLTTRLPDNIATAYNGRTWWKIRYLGNFQGDRTTWSVKLVGDPVRLLPNNPTTSAPPVN